jgi:hypothetical protein
MATNGGKLVALFTDVVPRKPAWLAELGGRNRHQRGRRQEGGWTIEKSSWLSREAG